MSKYLKATVLRARMAGWDLETDATPADVLAFVVTSMAKRGIVWSGQMYLTDSGARIILGGGTSAPWYEHDRTDAGIAEAVLRAYLDARGVMP